MAMAMEGPLMKWTNVMKGWQYRWFVLDESSGLLSYYTSKEKMARGARRGCVRLKGAIVSIDDDECTFTITVDSKVFHFQAQNAVEREKWIRALDDTRQRHAQLLQKRWDPKTPVPTVDDFNKKLTETDAFLQIMMDQVKVIESKMEKCNNPQALERLTRVRDKANAMLESIKHSIVLLQIAKNVAHPVNGIYQPNLRERTAKLTPKMNRTPTKKRVEEKSSPQLTPSKPGPPSDFSSDEESFETVFNPAAFLLDAPLDAPIVSGIEAGVECFEDAKQALAVKGDGQGPTKLTPTLPTNIPGSVKAEVGKVMIGDLAVQPDPLSSVVPSSVPAEAVSSLFVPETSYSSSEDEDFFDASEFAMMPGSRSSDDVAERVLSRRDEDSLSAALRTARLSIDSNVDPLMDTTLKNIDYDEIYEDSEEEELGSVESQGSVISHLLSQVKLGMDLTKVVLPTFILERRSLLEMYADFFAHPDLFVSIVDHADPKDRMIQAVRWYLSAFHAGRKSSVAKKPYNPILGEMFKCIWDVPGLNGSTELTTDGPVPWAAKGQLTFVAEQVSHHPPISAFYAEHYDKRITLGAHIWTKSKFLGLSIGVHMIGQGCISLVDYDEEYILTFPNGYGRSILTIPWVELGGSTSITCLKTGYSANIEFITKPFYGGKKHRITAEVFQPNDKKPFLSMNGEWNGVIHAKWTDGRTEVFVDTTKIPIMKKKVEPVRVQEEYESRRLWKGVTAGLRYRHIEQATESKFKLEQRQREEARERKEKGSNWETRFFHEVGGNWVYDKPLQKRLSATTTT